MASGGMKITRVKLNHRAFRDIFEQWASKDGSRRMERAAAEARSSAPVRSGGYRDSIHVETVQHPTRPVVRVVADVDYAMVVESDHGTLARALDAAGGA